MDAIDAILAGLEAELVLERELGVRNIECDRSVLNVATAPAPKGPAMVAKPVAQPAQRVVARPVQRPVQRPVARPVAAENATVFDFVFLHDRPLSSPGLEMMTKIVSAMGKTVETAPIVLENPMPKAKVYVVLGSRALKMYFPGRPAEPGQWLALDGDAAALVTYSPEYVLRFAKTEGPDTEATQQMKKRMWMSLKAVPQRVKG